MSDLHHALHSEWDAAAAQAIIARHLVLEGPMLPILHALQEHFGFVPAEAVPMIADALNISRAEALGTLTFYHEFCTTTPPARVVKLCRAEACRAQGCEDVVAALNSTYGIHPDRPTADLAIETVYCLGNCALGPSAMVGEELFGRVDAARLAEMCGVESV